MESKPQSTLFSILRVYIRNDYLTGTPTYTLNALSNIYDKQVPRVSQAHARVTEKEVAEVEDDGREEQEEGEAREEAAVGAEGGEKMKRRGRRR